MLLLATAAYAKNAGNVALHAQGCCSNVVLLARGELFFIFGNHHLGAFLG